MTEWKLTPQGNNITGYEDITSNLFRLNSEEFGNLTEQQQDAELDRMISLIRIRNYYPIYYFTEEGIKEEIEKLVNNGLTKQYKIKDNKITHPYYLGNTLLDFLFPNLHEAKYEDCKNSCYSRFYDDICLKKCLRLHIESDGPLNMRAAYINNSRFKYRTPTNYIPIKARMIVEELCPNGGNVFDASCGYGGRMLGILTSSIPYNYYGCEPNTETYEELQQLGNYIKMVKDVKYKLFLSGSEDTRMPAGTIDLCFTCPPFFDLENYCNEETQSIIKFPTYKSWLEGFVRQTIKNAVEMLKDDGVYAVDISDYKRISGTYHLVEDWVSIAAEEGLYLSRVIYLSNSSRKHNNTLAKENIYVFVKNKENQISIPTEVYGNNSTVETKKQEKVSKEYNIIVVYNSDGSYKEQFRTRKEVCEVYNCSYTTLTRAIEKQTKLRDCFFCIQNIREEIEDKEFPWYASIDGEKFYTQKEIAEYCGVTKQAVSAAAKRNANKVGGKKIEWY